MNQKNDVLIQFKNISKKFNGFYAVKDLNLEIKEGEILGFLGPNGAGKSTTMKMLARLLHPNSGEIWIRDNGSFKKLTSKTKDYLLDNIGFLIENPMFYDSRTPRQILSYFAKLKGYPKKMVRKQVEKVVEMVGLSEWIDKKFKTFSKGMRQKIGVVSAIVHDPEIVVLDEPFTGLDPKSRKEIRDFIFNLKNMGKTLFISSHLLYEISEIADRVAMISYGKIIACDTIDNLEAVAMKSIIHLEILNPHENIQENIEKIDEIVSPLTGLNNSSNYIKYNKDSKYFEILFNGNPKNQRAILKALVSSDQIDVTEFSVPKSNLLESLYLDMVKQSDEDRLNNRTKIGLNLKQKNRAIKMQT
jgi:ABC-2 type transport system ATP-binding protein